MALPQLTSIKHGVLLIWQTFSRTRCIAVEPLLRMFGVPWPIARPSLSRLAVMDCLMTRKWREGLFLVENQIMKVMRSDFRTDFELKETTLMAFTELLPSLRYHNFDIIWRTFLFFKNWTKRVLAAAGITVKAGTIKISRQTEKSAARWYNTEGPEGVKWELGLAFCCPGKMGFRALGPGFGHWEWEKMSKWEWDKYF